MVRFSVLIPAYRELGFVLENLEKLSRDDVEILVAAQALPEEELRLLKEITKKYNLRLFIYKEKERTGKVTVLNRLIREARGEVLVFLDSDTRVINDTLLEDIEEVLKDGDFGSGVIKTWGNSPVQSGTKIDYLSISSVLLIQSFLNFSFGLNGAFFFAKREVIESLEGFDPVVLEDLDFGVSASSKGFRFVFIDKPCVETESPSHWRNWFKQRFRWYTGSVEVAIKHWRALLRKLPTALTQSLAFAPASTFFFLSLSFLANLPLSLLLGYLTTLFWVFYWKSRWRIKDIGLRDTIIYYFVYSPISFLWVLLSVAYAVLHGGRVRLRDWVVYREGVEPIVYPR